MLSLRFVALLKLIYDKLYLIVITNNIRETSLISDWNKIEGVTTVYVSNYHRIFDLISNKLSNETQHCHIHLMNVPLSFAFRLIRTARISRFYMYFYSARNIYTSARTVLGPRIASYLRHFLRHERLYIITTSPQLFRELTSSIFTKSVYNVTYIPAPSGFSIKAISKLRSGKFRETRIDNINLLYLGHPNPTRFPVKNLIPVLVKLRQEGYNFRFRVFFCRWEIEQAWRFYTQVRELIRKYNLINFVEVLMKNLNAKEKLSVLVNGDILLHPALADAAVDPPLTVIEGMTSGLCIVATNVQSLPYVLRHSRGLVVDRRRLTQGLYNVLRDLMENPNLIRMYALRAQEYAKNVHSNEAVIITLRGLVET